MGQDSFCPHRRGKHIIIRPGRPINSVVARLLAGYAAVILLLGLTWALGAYSLGQINGQIARTDASNDALLGNVTERIRLLSDEETGLRGYLLTGRQEFLQPYTLAQRLLPGLRREGDVLVRELPSERSYLEAELTMAQAWETWAQSVLRHPPANPRAPDAIGQQVEGKRLFDRFRAAASALTRSLDAIRARNRADRRTIASRLNLLSAAGFIAALLATLVIGWFTMRAISRPLRRLRRAAEAIGSGNLEIAVEVEEAREFADLAASMDDMRRQLANELATRERAEHALQREAAKLAAIIDTQSAIAAAGPDLPAVFTLVTERTQALTGADGAVVELVEGDEMVYHAATGTAASRLGLRLKRDASLSGLCVRTGELLRCDDTETDPRVDRDAARRVGARSMILVPLRTGDGSEGVLKVLSSRPHAFDGRDVETLQLMAGEIGAAMRTGTEFAAKQTLLGERTRIVEELASANTALQHRAMHDALTGRPNRVLLHDRLEQAMRTARRNRSSMALFLMDLNGFKEVNDTLGHEAGDTLLQEVARRLQGALRASDTVARLGGDEFAVVLPAVDAERAAAMAEKLQSALADPPIVAGGPVTIGASIGIALHPAHGDGAAVLMRCADAAMYAAKRGGRPYCIYHPEYDLTAAPRLARV